MFKNIISKEMAGVASIAVMLLAFPLLLWYWQEVAIPGQYPPGTKVIRLTAVAEGGLWTQDRIVGWSYWWKKPKRVEEIRLTQGDHVLLLLHSPDVHHSISIPELRIGPVPIPAGHTVRVEFTADQPGEINFMCVQVCGKDHSKLAGRFVVQERHPAKAGNSGL
jgi:heme/copper-type cytochrome/quinol oxidase subunit 2